jgi:hypothetical protein
MSSKAYNDTHKAEKSAYDAIYGRRYYIAHKAERAARNVSIKLDAFNAYGGAKCACCGFDLFDGLTIDHINGDGAAHRKAFGGGRRGAGTITYLWLKRNGYPPGFQVLCGGCNLAKGTKDHCPHKGEAI